MGRKRWKDAGADREPGSYAAWPHRCAEHPNFYRLSSIAKALLFEFLGQYKGSNNGDLCCAWGLMKERGWHSRATVERARDELVERGWIALTRQGGRNRPNLYALTFFRVNECGGKLDAGAPVDKMLGWWKDGGPPTERQKVAA